MKLQIRTWHVFVFALAVMAVSSLVFGAWGFIGAWGGLGLIGLIGHLSTGGTGGEISGSLLALLVSGPFGFCVIFDSIIMEKESLHRT